MDHSYFFSANRLLTNILLQFQFHVSIISRGNADHRIDIGILKLLLQKKVQIIVNSKDPGRQTVDHQRLEDVFLKRGHAFTLLFYQIEHKKNGPSLVLPSSLSRDS